MNKKSDFKKGRLALRPDVFHQLFFAQKLCRPPFRDAGGGGATVLSRIGVSTAGVLLSLLLYRKYTAFITEKK